MEDNAETGAAPTSQDGRGDPRFKRRIPCRVVRGTSLHSGQVLDVSKTGLFMRTGATLRIGEQIIFSLNDENAEVEVPMQAKVVWHRPVPPLRRAVAEGSVGLEIRYAPNSYYDMLADAERRDPST
jgi:Tfp pilus assembly protein PilZ